MAAASPKDFERLKISDPKIQIFHHPQHCDGEHSGLIVFKSADPLDFMTFDEFQCVACSNRMATQWFTPEYGDWIAEHYMSNCGVKCECGSAKIGIKPYSAGHSWWCPVSVRK